MKDWHSSPLERNVVIFNARGYPRSILNKHVDQAKKIRTPSRLCLQLHSTLMYDDQPTLKIVFPETLLVDLLKFLSIDTSRSYQSPCNNILEYNLGWKFRCFSSVLKIHCFVFALKSRKSQHFLYHDKSA